MSDHPKLAKFVGAEREEQFERAILRHGFKVMLLARFMIGVRGPVYLAAGVVRMPFRKFLLWDLVCATVVVGCFFTLSYLYGEHITEVLRDAEKTLTLVVVAAGLIATLWYLRRRRRRQLEKATEKGAETGTLTGNSQKTERHDHAHGQEELKPKNEEVA